MHYSTKVGYETICLGKSYRLTKEFETKNKDFNNIQILDQAWSKEKKKYCAID